MARSLSTAKFFASLLNRRAFAAAASKGGVSATFAKDGHGRSRAKEDHIHGGKVEDRAHEESSGTGILSPWTPDPVTGYYRPCHDRVAADTNNTSQELVFNHKS